MINIIPAVLEKNEDDFVAKVSFLPREAHLVHVDILEKDVWVSIEREFEVHLMMPNPEEVFELWKSRGAKRIIAHKITQEMSGVELGLALEMHVPIDTIAEHIDKIDFVQLMSIAKIGEQGHPLDIKIFDRIKEVKNKFPGLLVSVDGGINISNYEKLIEVGADRLVSGSGFNKLWQSLKKK